MTTQRYEIAVSATAEVRDVDGNLVSTQPVESTVIVNQEQLDELLGQATVCTTSEETT